MPNIPFTDEMKKRICAEYVECQNYSEVARRLKISASGVKKIVLQNPECVNLCEEKKAQNTKDIIAYMDTKKELVCTIIDTYLTALLDEERIDRATTVQLSTTLGTLIDKFTMIKEIKEETNGGVIMMPEVKNE